MQKLGLTQTQQTKLSPQQLQFVQLLQLPADALAARVQEEVASNPTLEEEPAEDRAVSEEPSWLEDGLPQSFSLGRASTRMRTFDTTEWQNLGTLEPSWHEKLLAQLAFLPLDARERTIAEYLVGSLSIEGYLRTSLAVVAHQLSLTHYLELEPSDVERVLHHVQRLDPPGIGARNLRECLLLQLARKPQDATTMVATAILTHAFEAFAKRNYRKMAAAVELEDEAVLKRALDAIAQLAPKPILAASESLTPRYKRPDFIVHKDEAGDLQVQLYRDRTPTLRIRPQYRDMLKRYRRKHDRESTEVTQFVQANMQRAQWFMEAIQQRRQTLLRTMEAIVKLQEPFFVWEDEQKLRPLFMRHIAEEIGMDVSTISRVVRGKTVATDLGVYPLKYFFSEGIATTEGSVASSRTIKGVLKEVIDGESKREPYTDEELVVHMKARGYLLARRTVAKYRAQLGLPVARMRRVL